jgi:hypothetical protein
MTSGNAGVTTQKTPEVRAFACLVVAGATLSFAGIMPTNESAPCYACALLALITSTELRVGNENGARSLAEHGSGRRVGPTSGRAGPTDP